MREQGGCGCKHGCCVRGVEWRGRKGWREESARNRVPTCICKMEEGKGWVVKSVITTREGKREGPQQVLKKRRREKEIKRGLHSEITWKN